MSQPPAKRQRTADTDEAKHWYETEDGGYDNTRNKNAFLRLIDPRNVEKLRRYFNKRDRDEKWRARIKNSAGTLGGFYKTEDEAIKRAYEGMDAGAPAEIGFDAYMAALEGRTNVLRTWSLFQEDYPLVLMPVSMQPPFEQVADQQGANALGQIGSPGALFGHGQLHTEHIFQRHLLAFLYLVPDQPGGDRAAGLQGMDARLPPGVGTLRIPQFFNDGR